ncbi:hypothetical protein HKX69_05940 [Streptomyces argyrophyllae]|uniref:Uncharacterized protein n=1 Tax=Streptomyces argyrophylli TaxID=2726118 RepID=A0A6M4PFB5_9ACTN|nr:hypothetical protein [Streptomyces argyrophyllae]QJS09114.1 hypothetical protein HKX69_05940 [Streptomyces argyrophyllae]
MQFQTNPSIAVLFADATAALIRSRADTPQSREEQQAWHTLWVTFRDIENATLDVPDEAARLMMYVWGNRKVWRDEETRQWAIREYRPQWRAQFWPAPAMTLTYEPYPEPKRWTSDGGRLHWRADGDVVVTCSEHGEISRLLSTSLFDKEHPEYNGNSILARDNHLFFNHGIAQGHHKL